MDHDDRMDTFVLETATADTYCTKRDRKYHYSARAQCSGHVDGISGINCHFLTQESKLLVHDILLASGQHVQ